MPSNHLDTIIKDKGGIGNIRIVFFDVEMYSMRRSSTQMETIRRFTEITKAALDRVAQMHIGYIQQNDLNFDHDVIKIPTGDGIAVVFAFEGAPTLPLDFATCLLSEVYRSNIENECERFDRDKWCNCHPNFLVRVGVAEGQAILFKDVNGAYNVAGKPMNMCARIMGLAGGSQIVFSQEAYDNLIQLLPMDQLGLEEQFQQYPGISVKHGVKLDVYHYRPGEKEGVDSGEPKELALKARLDGLSLAGMPSLGDLDHEGAMKAMETMARFAEQMKDITKSEE